MPKSYSDVNPDEMILRDHLAHDRTEMANERTLLSYVRTAIAILAGGGTLLKVFTEIRYLRVLGMVLLVVGVLVLILGTWRFVVVGRRLGRIYRKSQAAGKPP